MDAESTQNVKLLCAGVRAPIWSCTVIPNPTLSTVNVTWEPGMLRGTRFPQLLKLTQDATPATLRIFRLTGGQSHTSPLEGALLPGQDLGRLGIIAAESFAPAERFILPVPDSAAAGWLLLCEVRFSRRSPRNTWAIGAQLLAMVGQPTNAAHVPASWLGQPQARHLRVPGQLDVALYVAN